MPPKTAPKRQHHFLQRLYLKGFADHENEAFIWEYDKSKPFSLTSGRIGLNPYHKAIRNAASTRDLYAVKNHGEITDFDSFENEVEALENPATPIFQKIRHYLKHDLLTSEEKLIFARYILLTIKRVPSEQKKRAELLWPPIAANTEYRLKQWLDDYAAHSDFSDQSKLATYDKRKNEIFEIIVQYKKGIPDELRLKAMVGQSDLNFPAILATMHWQLLTAPGQSEYFTSDNPVFFFEEFGINKNISELTFPISSKVCLVASWHDVQEGYFVATPPQVQTINERTAQRADSYLYAASRSKAIYDFTLLPMADTRQIRLLYQPYYLYRNAFLNY